MFPFDIVETVWDTFILETSKWHSNIVSIRGWTMVQVDIPSLFNEHEISQLHCLSWKRQYLFKLFGCSNDVFVDRPCDIMPLPFNWHVNDPFSKFCLLHIVVNDPRFTRVVIRKGRQEMKVACFCFMFI